MAFNKSLARTPMPGQNVQECVKNFNETTFGYTAPMAVNEAQRCLHCKNAPCMKACPVGNDIPGFLQKLACEDYAGAYQVLEKTTSLPGICGRVCPHEKQCEGHCTRGIKGEAVAIGWLERFISDWHMEHQTTLPKQPEGNGHLVAVVGSGPSGLTAAGDLAKAGYAVTLFEGMETTGGILTYGIPEFRLPNRIVEAEVEHIRALGVEIQTCMVIGKVLTVEDLLQKGFEAVYLATGASAPRFMGITGEGLKGVCTANEYLMRVNQTPGFQKNAYGVSKNVVVVGGGNVAMDAVRCARRLGADSVTLLYRRSMDELPAGREEVKEALAEGVIFHTLVNPVALDGDANGYVQKVRCEKMCLGEPDASGRRRPIPVPESEFDVNADLVILALGTDASPLVAAGTEELQTDRWGCVITLDSTGQTTRTGVYAGGDAVTGPATVVQAMAAGKRAAAAIDAHLKMETSAKDALVTFLPVV